MYVNYSSNNEVSDFKSSGPFRITNSGASFAGTIIPLTQKVTNAKVFGVTNQYGLHVTHEQNLHSIEKNDPAP